MSKSKRNTLAGKFTGKSESSKYFASHPEARAKKNAYNKKYHATDSRKHYRVELNQANKDAGTYGNKDGLDMSHTRGGKLVRETRSNNRARNGKGNNKKLK